MFFKKDFTSPLGKRMQQDFPYLFYEEEQGSTRMDHRGAAVDARNKGLKTGLCPATLDDVLDSRDSGNASSQAMNDNGDKIDKSHKGNQKDDSQTSDLDSKTQRTSSGLDKGKDLGELLKVLKSDDESSNESNNDPNPLPKTHPSPCLEKSPLTSLADSRITPYTIVRYMRSNKVVGEEANSCLIAIALSNNMHTILEGYSGSGKNFVMDKLLELFDGKYELQLSSGQAVWYHADEINSCSILYLPELQKAVADKAAKVSGIIELMKALGEGKPARRVVTNKDRTGIDTYVIEANKTIASTIAHENDFKYDREFQRRFLILETDNSPEHISEIIRDKVSRKMALDVSRTKEHVQKQLRERIAYSRQLDDVIVLNPFIGYMESIFPVANKTQSYMDHYLNLFEAFGRFFSPEREQLSIEGNNFVMLNLEDVYNVFQMYHPQFINIMQSFNDDTDIPCFVPDWSECMRQGIHSAENSISIMLNSGEVRIGKDYPDFVSRWKENQLAGSKVFVQDYITGRNIEIADIKDTRHIIDTKDIRDTKDITNKGCSEKHELNPITDPSRLLSAYAGMP